MSGEEFRVLLVTAREPHEAGYVSPTYRFLRELYGWGCVTSGRAFCFRNWKPAFRYQHVFWEFDPTAIEMESIASALPGVEHTILGSLDEQL